MCIRDSYKTIKEKVNTINSLLCWSVTLNVHWKFGACQKWEPAGRIDDFGNFLNGFAKSPRVLRWFWILNECNFSWKIVKYCILSEICMIKTAPHITVSPQLWCIKVWNVGLHAPRFVGKILLSKLVERKKLGLICFPRIRFPGLIYCDQEPLCLLNVIEGCTY